MNGNAIAYPSASVLRAALAAAGLTTLGFFRLLGGTVPVILLEKRLRGTLSQLWPSSELAIANALIATAQPPPQPLLVTWSDGTEWKTSVPAFNGFPAPVPPQIGPSLAALPPGPLVSFIQSTPNARWTIAHSLPGYPGVRLYDQSSAPIQGEVTSWPGLVVVDFTTPYAGVAFLCETLDSAIAVGLAA